MAKTAEYTIHGPLHNDLFAAQHVHKSLPIRRDSKRVPSDLRELYRNSADYFEPSVLEQLKSGMNGVATVPNLPPTPPSADADAPDEAADGTSDLAPYFSTPVTPINQNSPPTPDNTPPAELKRPVPRPFLGTQPSLASTQAESFRTAREELFSEEESVDDDGSDHPTPRATRLPARDLTKLYPSLGQHGMVSSPAPSQLRLEIPQEDEAANGQSNEDGGDQPPAAVPAEEPLTAILQHRVYSASPSPAKQIQVIEKEPMHGPPKKVTVLRRGPSLRDRLEAVDRESPSASTEKFANIIGWSSAVANDNIDRRASGVSTTSTIGAMVFESAPLPKKRTTIRKVAKHDSLRCASEPLPASRRSGSGDSSHPLIHKKAKLSNESRWSYGSEATRSLSISSSMIAPRPEVIKVAIIPERSSSLQSSAKSSRQHSLSGSSGRRDELKKQANGKPPSSWQRKRTLSESQSDRGREQQSKLAVPPRSSSLSAPTSRTTSRANSITSDNLRRQRREAESDLRRTLERMESDRLISSLRTDYPDLQIDETPSKPPRPSADHQHGRGLHLETPGTSEWAALRPPSVLETPFSQPSFMSASPELRDATTVNFFPHNNHSLQLIEPNIAPESRAVREARKHEYIKDDSSSTQSPLKHPRVAPDPPALNVIPPTPLRGSGIDFPATQLGRRPTQGRSESFMNALTRGFSLRDAKNRKRGQQHDGNLSPFWRPQGFWEEFEEPHPKPGEEKDMQVHNSLGMPQERTVITGPVSLVRRISQRRKQQKELAKRGSSGSLAKIRATHKLYQTSILGMHLPFTRFGDMRDRMMFAKQRKEDERRERIRQDIRGKIGKEVVRQGDSRFLKSPESMQDLWMRH